MAQALEACFGSGGGGVGARAGIVDLSDPVEGGLLLSPSSDPALASRRFDVYTGDAEGEHPRLSFAKGTTTLAFRFQGGIVVSVDSRSTQGPYIGASAGGVVCRTADHTPSLTASLACLHAYVPALPPPPTSAAPHPPCSVPERQEDQCVQHASRTAPHTGPAPTRQRP